MSATSAIDTVVFDLGNVLIPWDIRWLLRKIFDTETAIESFIDEAGIMAWHAQQDAGYPVAQAVAEHSEKHPQHAHAIRALYERWHDTMKPAFPESVTLLRELKAKGFRLYALSNFSAELFAISRDGYDFWDAFEGIVLSGEERVNKPDPRIYQILFERFAITPEKAVFLDDSLPNVEASRALGMRAIHFKDAAGARPQLRDLGLPV
ncbi:HAD family phosphatase [Uliginosibacterium sp. H3]|uniref:HAD family phosphatase n=1 Tax=Uliginosibacterium silvisoli TaxID=3114758 RepID=A0ABU6K4Q3_9RHOO|nr:HAD family phosphatase [Uliginosibacterium sp. H3]